MKFAVIGAGAGGQSMSAILTSAGHSVKLYDKDREKIEALRKIGSIRVYGKITAEATPALLTADPAEVMKDVDAVMVVTTTDAHAEVAAQIAPYLQDGQIILLHPGHVCGALAFSKALREDHGCKADLVIGETADLMYSCRLEGTGNVLHTGLKQKMNVATCPGRDIDRLMEKLGNIFPCLCPQKNILVTGFSGAGALLHPIPSYMNINKIDAGQTFDYYIEGISPSVARLITAADKERLQVCAALGLQSPSLVENLGAMYHLDYTDLYELIQHNEPYKGLSSPKSTAHRFLQEDVACGLLPLASMATELGIDAPIMNGFVDLAAVISGVDFRRTGRTAEKLGLSGKSVKEIYALLF